MSTMTGTDVQALFDEVCAAWNRGDAAGIAAHYAADGRLVDPFGGVADGRSAIEKVFVAMFRGLLAGTISEIHIDNTRRLAPGLLIVEGSQRVTGPLPALHVTAIVRQTGERAEILECRPYPFLPAPSP
jgi:uncharacterized protein (TIGR02246 family)